MSRSQTFWRLYCITEFGIGRILMMKIQQRARQANEKVLKAFRRKKFFLDFSLIIKNGEKYHARRQTFLLEFSFPPSQQQSEKEEKVLTIGGMMDYENFFERKTFVETHENERKIMIFRFSFPRFN